MSNKLLLASARMRNGSRHYTLRLIGLTPLSTNVGFAGFANQSLRIEAVEHVYHLTDLPALTASVDSSTSAKPGQERIICAILAAILSAE